MARSQETALVIATGERRIYANILLTIGVVPPT
jgi:L-fucose mutarotase